MYSDRQRAEEREIDDKRTLILRRCMSRKEPVSESKHCEEEREQAPTLHSVQLTAFCFLDPITSCPASDPGPPGEFPPLASTFLLFDGPCPAPPSLAVACRPANPALCVGEETESGLCVYAAEVEAVNGTTGGSWYDAALDSDASGCSGRWLIWALVASPAQAQQSFLQTGAEWARVGFHGARRLARRCWRTCRKSLSSTEVYGTRSALLIAEQISPPAYFLASSSWIVDLPSTSRATTSLTCSKFSNATYGIFSRSQ